MTEVRHKAIEVTQAELARQKAEIERLKRKREF